MKTLKAKITLILLALALLTAVPVELRADGNPFPSCNGFPCG